MISLKFVSTLWIVISIVVMCDSHSYLQLEKPSPCSLNHVKSQCTLPLFHFSVFLIELEHNAHSICGRSVFHTQFIKIKRCWESDITVNHQFIFLQLQAWYCYSPLVNSLVVTKVVHIFASFIKKLHPSMFHWIIHCFFSINFSKWILTVNFSQFNAS